MEHLLLNIFHDIFKYMIFQRCQKALLWSKRSINELFLGSPLTVFGTPERVFGKKKSSEDCILQRVIGQWKAN